MLCKCQSPAGLLLPLTVSLNEADQREDMASEINSKTTVTGADTGQVAQESLPPVTVSMKKLTAGVTTMFMGIVQMLEALEPQMAQRLVNVAVQGGTSASDADAETEITVSEKESETVETETAASGVSAPAASDDGMSADGTDKVPEVKQEETLATTGTSVTEDDITKIIVRKIKQDRSNNEKIGAILKTYGAAKVSDLPASKYEAFLTDVSQL